MWHKNRQKWSACCSCIDIERNIDNQFIESINQHIIKNTAIGKTKAKATKNEKITLNNFDVFQWIKFLYNLTKSKKLDFLKVPYIFY